MDAISPDPGPPPDPVRRISWPWLILRFPLTRMVVGTVLLVLVAVAVQTVASLALRTSFNSANPLYRIVSASVGVPFLCLVYAGFVRLIEWRRPDELGLRGAVREFLAGAAIGCSLMSVVIGLLFALGVYRVEGISAVLGLLASLIAYAANGIFEELLARCVWFRVLEEWLGTWLAIGISSTLFGFAHAFNPGATVWSCVAISLEAGVMLGGAFILTRRLWLAAGLHAAWNFTEGSIFGTPVSGAVPRAFLFSSKLTGNDWLTGGPFGPEASVVSALVCIAAGILLVAYARKRGSWVAPFWTQRQKVVALGSSAVRTCP